MKKVLLIGDSISMGYGPHVEALLAAKAEVRRNPGNAGDTDNTLAGVAAWLAEFPPDVVHFNCGLHDIKGNRKTGARQVPLDRYVRNLPKILDILRGSGAALIWATTTPVVEDKHQASRDFDRLNRDVDVYNAAARSIVQAAGVVLDDLHAAVTRKGIDTIIAPDGVHFTEDGYRYLGQVVAECIRRVAG